MQKFMHIAIKIRNIINVFVLWLQNEMHQSSGTIRVLSFLTFIVISELLFCDCLVILEMNFALLPMY